MAKLRILVLNGEMAGQTFEVPPEGATVGRTRSADIHLTDGLLSRFHCRFDVVDGVASVQDLGSSNGTAVNGRSLDGAETRALQMGDTIVIGETVLRVESVPVPGKVGAGAAEQEADSGPQTVAVKPTTLPDSALIASLFAPPPEGAPAAAAPAASAPAPVKPAEPKGEKPAEGDAKGEAPVPESVDLGLSPAKEGGEKKRNPLPALILALGAVAALTLGAGIFFTFGSDSGEEAKPRALPKVEMQGFEFRYESLKITDRTLFRYVLTYAHDGEMRLSVTDVGSEDRRFTKKKVLSEAARKALRQALMDANYQSIPDLFPERSADGVSLTRRKLTLVLGTEVWERTAENTSRPAFDRLCARLEEFGRTELGVWATHYSVAELTELGEKQLQLGRRYWEQRDLDDEKLFLAVVAYKQGMSALETLNPKPAFAQELTAGLRMAEALLNERYANASFEIEQQMNMQRYAEAAGVLRRVLRMIPDRDDERNQQATERLLLIEKRYLKKGGY